MSSGTNQERIEQNNLKLAQLKTKADNLPEYQNIEPIYASLDVEKVGHSSLTSLGNARVFYKDYIMTTNSTTLYIYKESLLTSINLINYNYSSFPIHILGETDEYIYIGYIVNANNATLNIYKFNKTENTVDFVKIQTTELISTGGYGWKCGSYSFLGTSMQIAPAIDYNNYLIYNAVTSSSSVARSTWTYFWVAKFNTETESLDVLRFITAGTIGRLIQVAPNYLLSALNDNDQWGQVIYKISIDSSNQVNYVVRKIEYTTTRDNYIQGISYDGKYAFSNGSVYTLKDDLTFNTKVGDNTYNLSMNYNIKAISDKYYLHNNNIYEFDENTMTFTLLLEGVYFINGIICIVKSSGTDRYTITPSQEQIGFIYNGFNYYFEQTEYTNTDKIVAGYEFFNKSHQKVIGTMVDNGVLNYTPSTSQQTIPAGYTSGGTIEAVSMSEEDIENAIAQAENILD